MSDFEIQFRGALWRYLKRNGHNVYRVTDYWVDTFVDYGHGFSVEYLDDSGTRHTVELEDVSLRNFVGML